MASRMICHGALSRCITNDNANGSNCGVCKVGTFRDEVIDFDLAVAERPQIDRQTAAKRVDGFASSKQHADRNQILDDLGRADARKRTPVAVCRRRQTGDGLHCRDLQLANDGLEHLDVCAIGQTGERGVIVAHLVGGAVANQPLPHRHQRAATDLALPDRYLAVDQKRLERPEEQPRRILGARRL